MSAASDAICSECGMSEAWHMLDSNNHRNLDGPTPKNGEVCSKCDGRGCFVLNEGKANRAVEDCGACMGTGENIHVEFPPNEKPGLRGACLRCAGSGKISVDGNGVYADHKRKCSNCHGTGRVATPGQVGGTGEVVS